MHVIFKPNRRIFALFILLFIAACGKSRGPSPVPLPVVPPPVVVPPVVIPPPIVVPPVVQETDVYVSGNLLVGFNSTAVYWKGNTLVKLGDGSSNTVANAIFIKDNDVYVAGSAQVSGKKKAVYWKNGNMVVLDDGAATDIVVQGTDVYVSGNFDYYVYGTSVPPVMVAAYWKNGVINKLVNPIGDISGGLPNADALAISVSGNDVYVGGFGNGTYGGGNTVALYWKNGAATNLTTYSSSFGNLCAKSMVTDLVVQGTDIYMAGFIIPATGILAKPTDIGGAVYWKNTTGVQLFDNSIYSKSSVIGINGSAVYTAGPYDAINAYYKKDNTTIMLGMSEQSPNATGIAFYNNDLYISGYSSPPGNNSGIAGYWKNNSLVVLATSRAQATGIVVTKHK